MTHFITALIAFWVGVYAGIKGANWYRRQF